MRAIQVEFLNQLQFLNGDKKEFPAGISPASIIKDFESRGGVVNNADIAAVKVNNALSPLCEELYFSAKIESVPLKSPEGALIHRHTLSFVLCAAAKSLFPDSSLRVRHSLGNAYYFSFCDSKTPSKEIVEALKKRIDDFITSGEKIEKKALSFEDARAYFKNTNENKTALLLEQTVKPCIYANTIKDYAALYIYPLLDDASKLCLYDIIPYHDGFLLRFPVFKNGAFVMEEHRDLPAIFSVFSESKKWAEISGVETVSDLNSLVKKRQALEYIRTVEAFADKKLSCIADMIFEKRDKIKLVMIAGPSSSGKTTTAKRLCVQLKAVGIEPLAISLDDYYLPPEKVPLDEKGEPDFECLESLDVPFLNEQLLALFDGKELALPVFDFKTGLRKTGRKIKLLDGMVLVLEGIHGLNDALTPSIKSEKKFKLYVSALTQLNIDNQNRIATTDNRLLRRIVRDYQFRGVDAEKTLRMWPDVQKGAEKHIFTFQNGADAVFNSALNYEIAVLKLYAEPLLRAVSTSAAVFSEASRLLSILNLFSAIPSEQVPPLSVLREFIGGSDFKY